MKSKFKNFTELLFETVKKPELRILPGQLAFFFVLSVIPLIALFAGFASLFNVSTNTIIDLLNSIFPTSVATMFKPIIEGKTITSTMIAFYISAIILASNGTHSMIISSNTIYKFKDKGYLSRRIKALFMTFILVCLLVFVLVVPAFGDTIVKFIAGILKNDNLMSRVNLIYSILKYPVSIILIYFNIKLLYTIAPDGNIKSYQTTYGSLFTTIGWILSTEIYTIYTSAFSRYNIFYGSVANILILMFWVYILAFIFVLGMALNASYYRASLEEIEEIKEVKNN